MTKYGKQRNGHGSTLQMNQMWWHNYLKKHAPAGDPEWRNVPLAQDTEESKAATGCLVDTLEWHLNSVNKKATHTVWRHKPEDTVCSVLDCRIENMEYDDPHPGGGEKGAKSILKDKELHQRIEQLGRQIKLFTRRKDYAGKNMVIVVVGHGLGLGPETRIARAVHTWTAMKWSDKSRVRLFYLTGQKPFVFGSGQQGYIDVDRELPTVPEAEGEEEEEDSGSEGGDPIPPSPAPRQERLPQDIPIERNIFSEDSDEGMDRETTGEPEMEHIPSSRRRSADSTAEGPLTSRRRISSSGLRIDPWTKDHR